MRHPSRIKPVSSPFRQVQYLHNRQNTPTRIWSAPLLRCGGTVPVLVVVSVMLLGGERTESDSGVDPSPYPFR